MLVRTPVVDARRRRGSAPIFDFPSLRDRADALDHAIDAAALLVDFLSPYRRRSGVVRAATDRGLDLAARAAAALLLPFDERRTACAPMVLVVEPTAADAFDVRDAIAKALDHGAREVVVALATGSRFALREIARHADAVYCASMRTALA